MYGKLFKSLYEGSLRGKSHEILVFTNMIGSKDENHNVDKTQLAISQEVGLTEEEVCAAIKNLEAPDPKSRTEIEEGRRIIRLDEHRDWGWWVVNGEKYERIKNEEDRREANRISQQRYRDKKKTEKELAERNGASANVMSHNAMSAPSAHIDIDTTTTTIADDEWMSSLRPLFESKGLDMEEEYDNCFRWYKKRKLSVTRGAFERWGKNAQPALKPKSSYAKGPSR